MPRRAALAVAIAVVIMALLLPWAVNDYWIRVATKVMMFAALASSWNLIAGFCGYPSFGQVAFLGLGAYAAAITMVHLKWPFFAGLVVATCVAAGFAALVGFAVLRLRGHYFAVATLGVAEALKQAVANAAITGGGEGMSFPLPPWTPDVTAPMFYYGMSAVLVAVLLTLWWTSRTRIGYAWRAIRVNQQAAQTVGINTTFYKVVAWTLSAAFTGAVGAIYGYWIAFIEPGSVFSVNVTVEMIVVALLGGVGTILGPVLGAAVFEILSEVVWSNFLSIHGLVLAVLFTIIILLLPGGLIRYVGIGRAVPARNVSA